MCQGTRLTDLLVPLSLLPSLLPGWSWPLLPFSLLPWPFSLFGALPSLLVGPSSSAPSLQRSTLGELGESQRKATQHSLLGVKEHSL